MRKFGISNNETIVNIIKRSEIVPTDTCILYLQKNDKTLFFTRK